LTLSPPILNERYGLTSSLTDCQLRGVVRVFRLLEHGRKIREPDRGANMSHLLCKLWRQDEGQDIAEYAVMLAVILVLVVGTVRLIGSNANTAFSQAASSIQ
jgi:Flp pilus assembly pilin Flp